MSPYNPACTDPTCRECYDEPQEETLGMPVLPGHDPDCPGCAPIPPFGREVAESPTGARTGTKLARFDLIPAEAMWLVAEVYGLGAQKYGDGWNWRKGMDWSLVLAKLERHLNRFKAGEDIDPENGQHHLASVVFHALTLLTYEDEQPDYDDRWKK